MIHVLVQLPATGWKRHKIEEQDVTETYADHLQAVDVQALNNPRKVEAFISSPLGMKYPTKDDQFVKAFPEVFEYSEEKKIQLDAFSQVKERFSFHDDESMNIHLWDSVILTPFEKTSLMMKLPGIKFGRNQPDKSTTVRSKRPDFLIWIHDALVFKGEEKGSSSEIKTAEYELLAKMRTMTLDVFGNMPQLARGSDFLLLIAH